MSTKTITSPISAEFAEFCRENRLAPEQVLNQFIQDLAETK